MHFETSFKFCLFEGCKTKIHHNILSLSLNYNHTSLDKSFTLDEASVLVVGLSAESSCSGMALQAVDACTKPYVSDLASKAVAGAAGEPQLGAGEVFGQHSVPDPVVAGQGRGLHWCLHGPETSYGVGEHHLAASQGAQHEGHT